MVQEPSTRDTHEQWLLAQQPTVIRDWLERRLRDEANPSIHPQEVGDGYLRHLLRQHPNIAALFNEVGDDLLSHPSKSPVALCNWALGVLGAPLNEAERIETALFVGDDLAVPFREMTEENPTLLPHPLDMLLCAWVQQGQLRDEGVVRRLRKLMQPVGAHDPTLGSLAALMNMQPRRMEWVEIRALVGSWVRFQKLALPMSLASMLREHVPGVSGRDVKAAFDELQPSEKVQALLIDQVAQRLDYPERGQWLDSFQVAQ